MKPKALSLLAISLSSPVGHQRYLVRHYGFVFLGGMQAGRDELVENVEFNIALHDIISKCASIGSGNSESHSALVLFQALGHLDQLRALCKFLLSP
jgi:hypothetical protein